MLGTRRRGHTSEASVLGRETRRQTRARAQGDGVGDHELHEVENVCCGQSVQVRATVSQQPRLSRQRSSGGTCLLGRQNWSSLCYRVTGRPMMAVADELCIPQNESDQAQILPMADHMDWQHPTFREGNERAHALTQGKRRWSP